MPAKNSNHKIVTGEMINYVSMLSLGYTVAEIAECYQLKVKTLEAHLLAARKTFQVRSAAHLVAYFLRNGLMK